MKSVLALIHGGKSFVHQIVTACRELDMPLSIASSAINDQAKIDEIASLSTAVYVGSAFDLSTAELKVLIEAQKLIGNEIIAVISVWENYRPIMSELNLWLGCPDLTPAQVAALRDKFNMRQTLRNGNLSHVNSQLLTKELFDQLKQSDKPSFVKPRQGIASFGAFTLNDEIQWSDVTELVASIQEDATYSSSFTKDVDLIVEDFIGGTEYCLEMIVYQGHAYVVVVHEKVEIESISRLTTLENVSATPPVSLNSQQVQELSYWVKDVFRLFDIEYGCFHVEAKLDTTGWEIIEINPRVGGAYINESVEHVTDYSLLNLWLRILTATNDSAGSITALLRQLEVTNGPRDKGSFFRVFYAEPGRTIRSLDFRNVLTPIHSKVLMTPGTHIPNSDRELYVAQGLWPWSGDIENPAELFASVSASAEELEVVYE